MSKRKRDGDKVPSDSGRTVASSSSAGGSWFGRLVNFFLPPIVESHVENGKAEDETSPRHERANKRRRPSDEVQLVKYEKEKEEEKEGFGEEEEDGVEEH